MSTLRSAKDPNYQKPLTRLIDFDLFEGEEARLETDRMIEGRKRFKGVLAGYEDGNVLIDDKAAPQVALGALMRVVWIVPAMDRLWTDAPEQRRRFLTPGSGYTPGNAQMFKSGN